MTITRTQVRELADFRDGEACAVSFYFQPSTPRNKAHKEDAIVIKDLAREAMRNLESKGKKDCGRSDIERIVQMTANLRSNGTHAKAIFACAARNIWREYDLQSRLPGTQLFVDQRFHIKPLAHLLGAFPRLGVVLVDRHRARIFDLCLGALTEREDFFQPLTRRGRSDGFNGYDAGHAERRVGDEARQHFKNVAEAVKRSVEEGVFEKWILACQDSHASQIEAQLHAYARAALLGRFHADLGHVALDQLRADAERIVERWQLDRRTELVEQAVNQARSNKLGVTGLRRVLRSLEQGEVQTLLIGENFLSHAVECASCGHIDAHLVSFCPVCGRATQEVVDVGEAILPWVIRRDIELFYVKDDAEFDQIGNIAALLRFRSDNVQPITATAKAKQGSDDSAYYPGRLRRYARG
jgi:peptide subunit release factor 1 (eRF1)